jgi:hypothetical protein
MDTESWGGGISRCANNSLFSSHFLCLFLLQGPLSRTTSEERERAMERERKWVSKIRESARADVDYHSQFNSEHLHWDPL